MIRHGNVSICANCKPIFMQKLAEGATIDTGNLNYAGFWIRFGAVFIDGIILQVVFVCLRLALGVGFLPSAPAPGAPPAVSPTIALIGLLNIIIAISYETLFIGKWGATPGKMACKIKVVTPDGGRVSYLRALGRYFAKLISGIILCIGYIMAGFDSEKRALHDRICNTRVIYK
jgi:uncharacterized RDD family membrane protein YckC